MTDPAAYDGAYLLDSVYNFIPYWELTFKDDPLAFDIVKRLRKYARLHGISAQEAASAAQKDLTARIGLIAKGHFQL